MSYEIVNTLDTILGPSKSFGKGEYYYYCPFCHHYNPKLAININKRKWQCWKCGAKGGTLFSLLKKLNVDKDHLSAFSSILSEELPKYKENDDSVALLSLPTEYIPLCDPPKTLTGKHAKAYLVRRGYTDADILRYNIGYCEEGRYQNRVIIPSYDASGMINFFVGRDIYGNSSLSYLIPSVSRDIIGFDYYINWKCPIYITEGVFDAMAVKRNSIPLFGKTLSKKLQEKIIHEGVNEVYLILDTDALKDTVMIAEKFMAQGITVFVVEMPGKDPSELGFEHMQKIIKASRPMTFMDLMQYKMKLVKI